MRRWGKSTLDEIAGSVLFFALAGAAVFSFSCYAQLWDGVALYGKTKSDFLLMTTQCTLAIAGMALPIVIDRKWKLNLPPVSYLLFYVFLFCAVLLGEILSFYYLIGQWDMMLHFFSGVMLGLGGFAAAHLLARKHPISPLFAACFALCFSLSLGAVWEIYEYLMDGLLRMNMQKFADDQLLPFTGRRALSDTMEDLLVDAVSALITATGGFLILRHRQIDR